MHSLAKNLYASSARFVFELLQNADDNCFKKASAHAQDPYIAFSLYSDRIIVDCNEDGFTYANLKAISAVGQSSKSGSQGYIGEKGIGFKSVFMVAWKVTIQSGDFSFFFKHRRNEQGLGMIRPIWVEPAETLPRNMTRMTLLLHDIDQEEQRLQHETIRRQLSDLQESLLLFTQNLKEIRVAFYDDNIRLKRRISFSVQEVDASRRNLVKRTNTNGNETITHQLYHVTTRAVYNLSKNENRTYLAEEDETNAYARSKVVLGFRLSDFWIPMESYQSVYAFLPVREAGFKVRTIYQEVRLSALSCCILW